MGAICKMKLRAGTTCMAALISVLLASASASASASAQAELSPLVGATGETPPLPWVYAGLPGQNAPPTRYAVGTIDGGRAVRIEADRSYGNLLHPLPTRRRVGFRGAGVSTGRWPPPTSEPRSATMLH